MELTLLEVNLDEPSFSANAPFSGDRSAESEDGGTDVDVSTEDGGSSRPSPVPFLVGLVFLVGVGLAIRRLRRSGSSSAEAEAETEPIAA